MSTSIPALDPVADVTRRRLLTAVPALALVAAGLSCSDASSEQPSPAEGFPRTIAHMFGETVIPTRPARVVCLDVGEADAALALGVAPLAINYWEGAPDGIATWQRPYLPDPWPVRLRWVDGPDVEGVALLDPDIVLGSYIADDEYRQLSGIAPTVVLSYDMNSRDRALTVGRALGLDDRAAEAVEQLNQSLQSARAVARLEGRTIAVGSCGDDGTVYPLTDDGSMDLLLALGALKPPALAALSPEEPLSLEQLSLFEADILVMFYDTDSVRVSVESNPLLRGLDVARRGAYFGSSSTDDFDLFNATGLLQVPYSIDHFIPKLTALVQDQA
jgi:iron complex transport system substrate-binding protein